MQLDDSVDKAESADAPSAHAQEPEPGSLDATVYVTMTSTKWGEELAWEEMREQIELEKEAAKKRRRESQEGQKEGGTEDRTEAKEEVVKEEVKEEDQSDPWLPKEKCLMVSHSVKCRLAVCYRRSSVFLQASFL